MKSLLIALILVSGSAQAAQKISCRLNLNESKKLVSQQLEKHPEAKGRQGDDGAIIVADLKKFSLSVDPQGMRGGFAMAPQALGEKEVAFDQGGLGEVVEQDKSYEVSFDSRKMIMELDVTGYDHFSYKVKIDSQGKKASLAGHFDYDCGGDGSKTYAVYDCTSVEE